MASVVNKGLINNYTIRPRNLTQYTAFRGVTDFTQIGQFNQFETGYSFLSVIQMPKFLTVLGQNSAPVASLVNSFKHMLEYEFRGLTGLPDITGETFELTDGVNTQNIINKVTSDTSITVSSNYFEKSGGLITKFTEYYLTGIKDRITQAKHYHGLIKNNKLQPGYENEVFTMMYYVTDNTMLRLEKAYLLCNCQLTKAETSIYDSTKGDISNKEMTIEWNCFPVWGYEVDKAAKVLLEDITGVSADVTDSAGNVKYSVDTTKNVAALDSNDYLFGVLDSSSPDKITNLVNAVKRA
jgi:hypothetical protein